MFHTLRSKKMLVVISALGLLCVPLLVGYLFFHISVRSIEREEDRFFRQFEVYKHVLLKNIVSDRLGAEQFSAQGVAVYDLVQRDYLYEKNSSTSFGIASLTKIMTAIIALELYDPNTVINLSPAALAQIGEGFFVSGQRWNIMELLRAMLIISSNDAAFALAEQSPQFLEAMNMRAKTLGMTQTYFKNATGLDEGDQLGAESSVHDMVLLMQYLYDAHPSLLTDGLAVVKKEVVDASGNIYTAVHTHEGIENISNPLFSKTGYTALANGTILTVVQEPGQHPLLLIALGSTFEGRFSDMHTLSRVMHETYTLIDESTIIRR